VIESVHGYCLLTSIFSVRLSVRVALRKREFRKFLKSLSLSFSLSLDEREEWSRFPSFFFSLFLSLRDCAIDFQALPLEGVEETKVE
jgi:hypothetical protein